MQLTSIQDLNPQSIIFNEGEFLSKQFIQMEKKVV